MSATVIIPTTGSPEVHKAIKSVLNQTYPTKCYLVCDGQQFKGKVKVIADTYLGNPNFEVCYLPENVGANGYYGHRIYASFTHLVNSDYILYLDQDNWFNSNHVQTCVDLIEKNDLEWCYSLRKICDKDGNFICKDDCESLGKYESFEKNVFHCDTNTYCLPRMTAIQCASAWHGGWGQDRIYLKAISHYFTKSDCTGEYSVNYRIGGNEGSVRKEFFEYGNKIMNERYNGEFPWRKKI